MDRRRVLIHIGGDQVVWDQVFEKVEPEQRYLRQDLSLVRDAGCQDLGLLPRIVSPVIVHDRRKCAGPVQFQNGISQRSGDVEWRLAQSWAKGTKDQLFGSTARDN